MLFRSYILKNFLKIFIFLEIILLAYIFNTSIYNIYEKNNIATEKLEGYVLEETSPEIAFLRLYLLTTYSANCFIKFISQMLYMRLKRGHKYVIDYIKKCQKRIWEKSGSI